MAAARQRGRERLLRRLEHWLLGNDERDHGAYTRPLPVVGRSFRARPEGWREQAEEVLGSLHVDADALDALSQRYFAGHTLPFPASATALAGDIAQMEQLVRIYNDLVGPVDHSAAWAPSDARPAEAGQAVHALHLDTAGVRGGGGALVAAIAAGLVDFAKAEACHDLGEHEAGIAIMERYLLDA